MVTRDAALNTDTRMINTSVCLHNWTLAWGYHCSSNLISFCALPLMDNFKLEYVFSLHMPCCKMAFLLFSLKRNFQYIHAIYVHQRPLPSYSVGALLPSFCSLYLNFTLSTCPLPSQCYGGLVSGFKWVLLLLVSSTIECHITQRFKMTSATCSLVIELLTVYRVRKIFEIGIRKYLSDTWHLI